MALLPATTAQAVASWLDSMRTPARGAASLGRNSNGLLRDCRVPRRVLAGLRGGVMRAWVVVVLLVALPGVALAAVDSHANREEAYAHAVAVQDNVAQE